MGDSPILFVFGALGLSTVVVWRSHRRRESESITPAIMVRAVAAFCAGIFVVFSINTIADLQRHLGD